MDLGAKLKYVAIELMKKDATTSDTPEAGLLRGMRTRVKDDLTLALILIGHKNKPDSIRGLNADLFNVMTLMLMYGSTKEMVVFKNTEDDQKQAAELLEATIAQMKEDELMLENDPDIADVNKFESVPEEFFAPKKDNSSTTTFNRGAGSVNSTTGQTDWQKKQEAEKKEKERQEKLRWVPTTFSRDGKKPLVKDLNAVKKKVAAIAKGEYEYVPPEIEGDDEGKKAKEKEDKKTTKVTA